MRWGLLGQKGYRRAFGWTAFDRVCPPTKRGLRVYWKRYTRMGLAHQQMHIIVKICVYKRAVGWLVLEQFRISHAYGACSARKDIKEPSDGKTCDGGYPTN